MNKIFEDKFTELQTDMIQIYLEYVNYNSEFVYIYASIEVRLPGFVGRCPKRLCSLLHNFTANNCISIENKKSLHITCEDSDIYINTGRK